MRKLIFCLFTAGLLGFLIWGGGYQRVKESHVEAALRENGYSTEDAQCIARRMVKRLSLAQLWRLQRFSEESGGIGGMVKGIKRVGNGEAVAVAASAVALCKSGLAD